MLITSRLDSQSKFTLHFFCIPCSSTRVKFLHGIYMQGNLHVHVRFSRYTLQYFSDGWWRRECLILVNISMFCNRCKNLLAETYLQSFWYYCIASETNTNNYHNIIIGIKYCDFCFQGRKLLLFYLHALGYVIPLVLYYTKLGYFFLQLTKGALLFRMEVS